MPANREYRVSKAIGPQGLTLHDVPIPKPRGNEVVVKVHAVSLQYRDLAFVNGELPPKAVVKDAYVPCSDAAGEIIEVGQDVVGWKKGDRVCANFSVDLISGYHTPETFVSSLGGPIDGVLTEYKALPAHSLVHIPEHLSYEEASTLPCAAVTAYNALNGPVPAKCGDYVLVQGTGGVAIFAIQFAVAAGAIVIATSSSDEKLQIPKKLGAKHVINYKKTPNWEEEVMKITNGRGVDHVIDVGGVGTISKSLSSVTFGGWVHEIGFLAREPSPGEPPINMQCLSRSAMLRGILVGSRVQFEAMNRFITAIQLRPVIDKVFPFEHTREAYEYLASQGHVGKIVIKVAGN